MDIHFYLAAEGAARSWLEKSLDLLGEDDHSEVHRSIAGLEQGLRRSIGTDKIVVLEPASPKNLVELASLKSLLGSTWVIVILPDRDPETVARALTLRPRFISYIDQTNDDLIAVLGKMISSKRKAYKELKGRQANLHTPPL